MSNIPIATKGYFLERASTLFLRGVVLLMGAIVLAICVFGLPKLIVAELTAPSDFDYGPIFMGLYVTAVPFFIALYQTLKLLQFIDTNKAFSDLSVKALSRIKYCALVIAGMFAAGMPYVFTVAQRDDAPGVALIGFIIIGASIVIAVFAAVLEKLLHNAIELQREHELTV